MSEFPHVRISPLTISCRCGAKAVQFIETPNEPPMRWGSDCPIALREALADVTKERDAARLEARAYGNALARQQADDERIRRVKAIREETGCGLSEALAIVNGNTELAVKLHRTLVEERDELHAELANECGEGPPPSEGWAWAVQNTEGFWRRALDGDRRCDVTRSVPTPDEPEAWHWWIVTAPGGSYEHVEIHADGWEKTARAAMRAADAALTGAKP